MNRTVLFALILSAVPGCSSRVDVDNTAPAETPAQGDFRDSQTVGPVKVGSVLVQLVKIKDVPPVYPSAARGARVQGTVVIEATIESDGTVESARVLRSIPPLDQAALEAVRQWRFKPTLLNGAAIPVVVMLTVPFTLQ